MAEGGFTSFLGGFFGGFNFGMIFLIVIIAVFALGIIGGIIWYIYNRIQWNLKVEFKLTRSNGAFSTGEWGKGSFNSRKGVVFVKRKGLSKSKLEPFDIREYIQGSSNILTVTQVGVNTYKPVHPSSFETIIDTWTDEKGQIHESEVSVMKVRGDTTQDKAWATSYEREAKNAFSISGFLKEYGGLITMGLILFMQFIGFAVLYAKIRPT